MWGSCRLLVMDFCTNTCIIDCKGPKVGTLFLLLFTISAVEAVFDSQGFCKLKTEKPVPLELNQALAVKKASTKKGREKFRKFSMFFSIHI